MNKYLKLIFGSAIMLSVSLPAYAASLDELYREIIRDDNQGYLPIFVKNTTSAKKSSRLTLLKMIKLF